MESTPLPSDESETNARIQALSERAADAAQLMPHIPSPQARMAFMKAAMRSVSDEAGARAQELEQQQPPETR